MASVPIDERTKARIRELRDEIEDQTGRSVSERIVVERMLEREFESRDALVDSFRDTFEGLSQDEIEQWLSGTSASGDPLEEDEIDRVLYEEEAAHDSEG